MKRRLLSILLLCSMVLTLLPVTAHAEGEGNADLGTTKTHCYKCGTITTFKILAYIRTPIASKPDPYCHWARAECTKCGKIMEFVPDGDSAYHTGGTETPTCTTGKTCEKCGDEYGILGHDWGAWASNGDDKTHTRTCKRDGCTAFETEDCGGDGTATCVTQGTCTDCGQQYYGGHYFATPYTYGYDENYHWHACRYCEEGREAEGVHYFVPGSIYLKSKATCISKDVYYTNCGTCKYKGTDTYVYEWSKLDPDNHDGGTEIKNAKAATCTEKGYTGDTYCKGCGVKLEDGMETPALDHDWGAWTSNDDGTHTRVCRNDTNHSEMANCSGGTATCTAKAQCEDCQAEYGELAAHQFTAETVAESYLVSAATCTEPAVYYTSCAACGAKGTEIFTVGEPLDHDWGDWTSNGDGTHTRTCSRDATHTETGDCTGGTATCMAKAECETCGGAYGETDPDNHADGCYPEWTISKTHHQEKYTLCGQVLVAQEEHIFGEWNVTKKATTKQKGEQERICQVCEYHQFETIPVESDQDSKDNKDNKDNGKTTKATKTTKSAKDAKNGSPKTGDSSSVPLWTTLLCVSAVGVTGTVLSRKRKRTK